MWKNWADVEKSIANGSEGITWDNWNSRIEKMETMLSEDITSVLDLGAGNMSLKKFLRKGIAYFPVDHCKRFEETIVCDFNKYEFPEKTADAIFISGCLEYVVDYKWFVQKVCAGHPKEIILSYYVALDENADRGVWVNSLTYSELYRLFAENGYAMMRREFLENDRLQPLMKFVRIELPQLGKFITCNGCGACENICPNQAISMVSLDELTGYRPVIDDEKCIQCGKCLSVCSSLNPKYENREKPTFYAAWAKDSIRYLSSSGGMFSVLAQHILREGGAVYGAAWNEEFEVQHIRVDNEEDLAALRKSKYVQSKTAGIFKQVKKDLDNGKKVLFSGTPCQIAGLKNYIGAARENLYTTDLLCACVPSPTLFKKYLNENYDIKNLKNIVFRDKETGWHYDLQRNEYKDGSSQFVTSQDDMYQKAYHSGLFIENVCETCQFACFPRQGDITIGDFWGIGEYDSSWDDTRGTSFVAINSDQGHHLFECVKKELIRYEAVTEEYFVPWNRIKGVRRPNINRNKFSRMIRTHTFNDAVEYALSDKRDVGIVGMWLNPNYGGALTFYALYKTVKDLGYSPLMIAPPLSSQYPWRPSYKDCSFDLLPYDEADCARIPRTSDDYYQFNDICDVFMVGSDQLFRNVIYTGTDKICSLFWVNRNRGKLGYALSWGVPFFEGTRADRDELAHRLGEFQRISVREESSVKLMSDAFNVEADHVLDPVFLCNREYYDELTRRGESRLPDEKYLFAYILDPSEKQGKAITAFAERMGIGRIRAITDIVKRGADADVWDIDTLTDASVEEWVAHIKHAEYVITDSFHGTCFAILFNKPFVATVNYHRGKTRFDSLLNTFGLSDRAVQDMEELLEKEIFLPDINWKNVEDTLRLERERCIRWLDDSIAEGKKKTKEPLGPYEKLFMENIALRKSVESLEKEIRERKARDMREDPLRLRGKGMYTLSDIPNGNELRMTNDFEFVTKWLHIKQKGYSVVDEIRKWGYHRIAIYGLGRLGLLLLDEIELNEGLEVVYLMDRGGKQYRDRPVYRLPQDMDIDAVIVTPINSFDEIERTLLENGERKEIVSLERLVSSVYDRVCNVL